MGNILLNSFRMDTEMHSDTYWLKSRSITCVPDEVYKKLHSLHSNCQNLQYPLQVIQMQNPLKICNALSVWLKVYK